jgi:hypothetical protein
MTGNATEGSLNYRRTEDVARIAVLELRVNDHSEDLKQLTLHQEQLSSGITEINNTLQRILYAIVGAGGVIIAGQVGIVEFVMMLIQ